MNIQVEAITDVGRLCECGCGDRLPRFAHRNRKYTDACQLRIDKERRIIHKQAEAQNRHNAERETWGWTLLEHPEIYDDICTEIYWLKNACLIYHIDMAGVVGLVRMKWNHKIPNSDIKFYREKFIAEHPEYAKLFGGGK